MKKIPILTFLLLFVFGFSQKKNKKALDISSNIETKFILSKALGDNSLGKNYKPFYGFGFGGQLLTPIQWGIGLDYSLQFSDAKYGREHFVGNLGSTKLTSIDLYLLHKSNHGEDFHLEKSIGYTYFDMSSSIYPSKDVHSEGKGGINMGLKGIFTLDREERQQFTLGLKAHYYQAGIYNENKNIQKFYNKSFIVGMHFGYRYNF